MIRRRSTVAVLVAALVVGIVAVGGAGTVAAAEAGCDGSGLVATIDDGSTHDELHVVAGTPVTVVNCDDGDPVPTDEWTLEGHDDIEGLEVEAGDAGYEIATANVPDDVDGELSVADGSASVRLHVTAPGVSADHLETRVVLDDPNEFRQAADRYESEHAATRDLITAFEDGEVDHEDPLAHYQQQREDLTSASEELEGVLLAAAIDGAPGAYEAYVEQVGHSDAQATELTSATEAYVERTEAEAANDRLIILGAFLGPVLLGTVLGVGAGRWLTRSKLEKVRRQRRRDATVDYGASQLLRVLIGATIAVLAGIAALAAAGLLFPLIQVLL